MNHTLCKKLSHCLILWWTILHYVARGYRPSDQSHDTLVNDGHIDKAIRESLQSYGEVIGPSPSFTSADGLPAIVPTQTRLALIHHHRFFAQAYWSHTWNLVDILWWKHWMQVAIFMTVSAYYIGVGRPWSGRRHWPLSNEILNSKEFASLSLYSKELLGYKNHLQFQSDCQWSVVEHQALKQSRKKCHRKHKLLKSRMKRHREKSSFSRRDRLFYAGPWQVFSKRRAPIRGKKVAVKNMVEPLAASSNSGTTDRGQPVESSIYLLILTSGLFASFVIEATIVVSKIPFS